MEEKESTKFKHPAEYLKIFFRRKWLVITPTFIGLVAGIVACFLLPRTWVSTAIILVEEEKIINPIIQNLAVSTTAVQRMQSIREILLGWTSLVELTEKLNLAKDVHNQLQFENLILGLRRNIDVRMRQPNIIQIAYFGDEARKTQLVTKTLTDILVEKNLESQTKETDVAINFIKEQLAIYKRKIKESEIAQLEEQLKKLLADSTEQHPMVKELRQKIEIAKKELESDEYQVKDTDIPVTDNTRQVLKKELDKLLKEENLAAASGGSTAFASEPGKDANQAIYKLLLMDKVESSLAQDINVNEDIYNMLLQKLETAKITQRLEASREGTRYTIIDPPRLPLRPVKPNKVVVILFGMFAGSIAGTGLVFGREFLDQSFIDIEEVKQTLDLPVLGAISRLTTQEEIDKEKHNKRKWIITVVSISLAVIVTVMLFTLFK
jgi:succinoglycan biosynthesis transport protein ExoP